MSYALQVLSLSLELAELSLSLCTGHTMFISLTELSLSLSPKMSQGMSDKLSNHNSGTVASSMRNVFAQ
jgi:hypothetical protein